MVFLGLSSGIPFGVLAEPLTAWLFEGGVSKSGIGLFALVSLPYSLKFLWAPLIDHISLPFITPLFGRRRGWVLVTQVFLLISIIALGHSNPKDSLLVVAGFAVIVAFASASQDIVIDAYRVEILDRKHLAADAATIVLGWRVGQVGGAAAGLIFADMLPWNLVFLGMGLLIFVGIISILLNPEPAAPSFPAPIILGKSIKPFIKSKKQLPPKILEAGIWFYSAFLCPFLEFISRPSWLPILFFIMFYKFGDAVLAVMKIPFFLEIGFSKTEIAGVAKVFGFNAIVAGGFLGGILLARLGILRGLFVCGLLMGVSNLIFILQAWTGSNLSMLALTIAVENITTGMGTAAFVAYLSSLCSTAYTATQYALLTSLMAFSRTVMASGAGWLADSMDWVSFFIFTTIGAIPGLMLLVYIMKTSPQSENIN